jgi:Zn-dependent peptidase ImmA (M78 family)/transcriptional regulator with XRE-family HTH domain
MRVGTPGFVPERLTEARAARRIASMTALARLLSVSPSTVTRWEEGSSAPDGDALTSLSNILCLRREFFLRPVFDSPRPMFNRSLSSSLIRDIDYQRAQMRWMHETSSVVQHYIDFPEVDIPDVLEGASYNQLRNEDIERIALKLRQHWNIGEGPCTDVVALMERIGCVVSTIEMGTSKLDGLCSWSRSEDRPHILLATDKMSFPRRQMDAAHELAHAVLHRNVTEEDLKKNLKFILPSTTYPYEVSRLSLAMLVSLKETWRVSVKAQIKRLSDLDILPEDHATYLYKLYSTKGWSREEPLDREWKVPMPKGLSDAMNLIVESGSRTKSDLLALEFTMQAGDIENIANLPAGWFTRTSGQIVQLKTGESGKLPPSFSEGIVVPFEKRRS